MYQIKIHYQTGDSFRNEDREERIDFIFENLETAKENLRRIEEHYKMYQETGRNYHMPFKEIKKKYGSEPWFIDISTEKKPSVDPHFMCGYALNLVKDDGEEFRYSVFWTGYFEHLYGANIVGAELPSFRVY